MATVNLCNMQKCKTDFGTTFWGKNPAQNVQVIL